MTRAKTCQICEGAHGYTQCPEPLRFPSTPRKEGETEDAYAKRLRYNAYQALWMRKHPHVTKKRAQTMRTARRTEGSTIHANEKARQRRANEKAREHLQKFKSRPCADCGGTFPPFVMHFDHRDPDTKTPKYRSPGAMCRLSVEKLEEELAKCDVVCSNCHAIRTHTWQAAKIRAKAARGRKPLE